MIIAFSAEDNEGLQSRISHHFGRCPYYIFVQVEDKNIVSVKGEENPFFSSHQPGAVPEYISSKNAAVIVAGGMGPRAVQFFEQFKVAPIIGVSGKIEDVLDDILEGKYKTVGVRDYDPLKHDRHRDELEHGHN
jgi:predicted Fe-Mo cluster-binding NifX family protein